MLLRVVLRRAHHRTNPASRLYRLTAATPATVSCSCQLFIVCSGLLLTEGSLTTLDFADGAKYKARSSFSKAAVDALISSCNLNPLFVPDLLGRPNYWAPSLYSTYDGKGNLASVGQSRILLFYFVLTFTTDFFCQQPRFGIHSANFKQRSPVSIYMRYEAIKNLTYYIISAPESEEAITSFKSLLDLASQGGSGYSPIHAFQHPLEAHILLSKILCESSQDSINHFRQSMFAQVCLIFPSFSRLLQA